MSNWDGFPVGAVLSDEDGNRYKIVGMTFLGEVEGGFSAGFRIEPIRSAEEVAVDAMDEVYSTGNDGTFLGGLSAIYAAIRDGKIPGVKLEGQA